MSDRKHPGDFGGYEYSYEHEYDHPEPRRGVSPGKSPATARLAGRPQTNIIFRVADAASATALAGALGARDGNGVAARAPDAVAQAEGSSGQPLPEDVRDRFESSLGSDLSSVRVHTGPESATAAESLGAKAYTTGQDIHFNAGEYNPVDPFGLHLLAHEVAHTVQQSGSAPQTQAKLQVSEPGDAAEAEADVAADAMVRGEPAQVSPVSGVGRVVARRVEPPGSDAGSVMGAGDEAAENAKKAPLSIDSASVKADISRVDEIVGEIDANQPTVLEAERDDSRWKDMYNPAQTNTVTKANLQILKDSLGVTKTDTAAFAVQYRTAYADFQRLKAEGAQFLNAGGVETDDPVGQLSEGFSGMKDDSLKLDETQALVGAFRDARTDLNTAASKADGQIKEFRGAAQSLQGALYQLKARAAKADGEEAAKKLAKVQGEIQTFATVVGSAVKVASAVSGLAGGMSNANKAAAGNEGNLKMAQALFDDADSFTMDQLGKLEIPGGSGMTAGDIASGDPGKIAEGLAKIVGEQINAEKIGKLQQSISQAAAEEKTFKTAGLEASLKGFQSTMASASSKLDHQVRAFASAKQEMARARDNLVAYLSKQGPKGKDQAKAVIFVADADRFLAQVKNAITLGKNHQENAKDAASKRKNLRGTTSTLENEPDRATQKYWKAQKYQVPGTLWGTNDAYRLTSVDVTFDGGSGHNRFTQGGQGSVEGTGGAADQVARKLKVLEDAEKKVTELQGEAQRVLGIGGPGLRS